LAANRSVRQVSGMVEKDIRARSAPAAGLIDYQAGAIVSREIIRKGTGTVTLFAFDKGQGLSEHTAPYDALVHVLDGQALIRIGGRPIRAGKGELLIILAGRPHALKAVRRFKMLLTMIRSK
jgi:quercetin dioxygenase-like cupin family protein